MIAITLGRKHEGKVPRGQVEAQAIWTGYIFVQGDS